MHTHAPAIGHHAHQNPSTHSVCKHVCKALCIHDRPASCPSATGLGSVTRTATQKTQQQQQTRHAYSRGLLDQMWEGEDNEQKVMLRDWSTAQQL